MSNHKDDPDWDYKQVHDDLNKVSHSIQLLIDLVETKESKTILGDTQILKHLLNLKAELGAIFNRLFDS